MGGIVSACQDSAAVKVLITNEGTAAVSNIPVSYSLNGGSIVSQTFTGAIQPGLTDTLTFPGILNTSGPGSYQFVVWTSYSGDVIAWNDTAVVDFDIVNTLSSPVPFEENFDGQSLCPTTFNCGLTVCNLTGRDAERCEWLRR